MVDPGTLLLKIYIIVDAMEESNEDRKPEILELLLEFCSSEGPGTFKCLIASRTHDDIWRLLCKCDHIILQEGNRQDIETVTTKGLKKLSENNIIPRERLNRARNYLIKHCGGVFLWAPH
jgi:hypothetical protein